MKRYWILLFLLVTINLFSLESDRDLYTQAEREYLNGNYLLALEDYNEFVKEFPLSDFLPDVQYRRAVTFFRLGRYKESLELFRIVEKRYRATRYFDYVPFWEGLILYNLKDYNRAVDALDAFLKTSGKDNLAPKALLFKALSLYSLKLYDRTEETLKKLINFDSYEDRAYAVALLFNVLLKEGKIEELIAYSKKISPDNFSNYLKAQYYLYLAEAYRESGKLAKAEELYKGLINYDIGTASFAIRRLFNIAQKKNNLEEMEKLTQLAETKLAGNSDLLKDFWIRVGIESYRSGNIELANHFLSKVWSLGSIEKLIPAVPLYLSEIKIKKGNMAGAAKILENYIHESKKNIPSVIMRLGDIYLMLGDYLKAGQYYSVFMEDNPDSNRFNEAAYLLAYTYYRNNRIKDALNLTHSILEKLQGGPYYEYTLKLRAILLMHVKQYRDAKNILSKYVKVRPTDTGARMDIIKVAFLLKDYSGALRDVEEINRLIPELKEKDLKAYVLSSYIGGLSSIVEKQYSGAIKYLSQIEEDKLASLGLSKIYPYTIYYMGWAYYRVGDFKKSEEMYEYFTKHFKDHEFYEHSLYMAGWCSFSLSDFDKSISFFDRLLSAKEENLKVKAAFLKAKALLNMNRKAEAERAFEFVFNNYPDSGFADDALFDYSEILADAGMVDKAAKGYLELTKKYPKSPLIEESFYRRGELFFANGRYEEAKEAFYDYRVKFPGGKLMDAALYWGGYAAYKLGENFGAVLLWEKLISKYKDSPFRADALAKAAEIYSKNGDYKKALDLYTELLADHPKEAKLLDAEQKADKLRYLILGLGEKEAQLSAIIGNKGGAKSKEGRKAMIELAKLYITEENKMELAYRLLEEVVKKDDPQTKSKALYLLGEYYYRKNQLIKAGNTFLKAAFTNPKDRDLMAASIYRAAVMMKLAKKYDDMKQLVKRLEENFPATQWAEDGRKLLEGIQ